MKERVTIRLYERPGGRPPCDVVEQYGPAEEVAGWDYQRGDQIGLRERDGGYLMGGIDQIGPDVFQDQAGRYKLAVVWTLD